MAGVARARRARHADSTPVGVGLIGAGPVTRTVHLPTLARLADLFEVRAVMDIDDATARSVRNLCGGRSTTDIDDVLADEGVAVVAVCTPDRFHADHVVRALRAGKAAVFCEKPLATSHAELDAIEDAAAASQVPLIVGTMHAFDPVWTALPESATTGANVVRSSIVLPLNQRFESWAADWTGPTPAPVNLSLGSDSDAEAELMRAAVLGLAVHDLPLVRKLVPQISNGTVTSARVIQPFGYAITVQCEDTLVHLSGLIHQHWEPRWELEAIGESTHLLMEFTPSFVHAGSARAEFVAGGTRVALATEPRNGYEGEWRAIAAMANSEDGVWPRAADVIADCRLALNLAESAGATVRGTS